jgi:hypothetical protein
MTSAQKRFVIDNLPVDEDQRATLRLICLVEECGFKLFDPKDGSILNPHWERMYRDLGGNA